MLYISELFQRDYDDTNRGQVNRNSARRKEGRTVGNGGDQGRVLGMATGEGRVSNGKNRTIFWGRVHVVEGGGGGNSALMDFVGMESQGERI